MEVQEYVRDKLGRLDYHPDLHPNHGTVWSDDELEYLCKFHETDEIESIALAFGRTTKTVNQKLATLRENVKYAYYRKLDKHYVAVND